MIKKVVSIFFVLLLFISLVLNWLFLTARYGRRPCSYDIYGKDGITIMYDKNNMESWQYFKNKDEQGNIVKFGWIKLRTYAYSKEGEEVR